MSDLWTSSPPAETSVASNGTARDVEVGGLRLRPRWRARRIALVSVLVLLACALIPTALSMLQPKVYGAQVELLLRPRPEVSDTAVERAMLTEEVVLKSPALLGRVAARGGTSLASLQAAVSTSMVGRSNVLTVTLTDRNPDQAVALLRILEREYAAMHATDAQVDPTSPDGPTLNISTLTPAQLLDKPVQPQPLRAFAAGTLVGLVAAAALALILLRPVRVGRRSLQP